jgi:hypothetical protein
MGQKSPLKKRHAPLLLGYVRISTADGLQVLDRQRDTLIDSIAMASERARRKRSLSVRTADVPK